MTENETAMKEEDLKRYWYNRWKEGFEWFTMAGTLKASAYSTRGIFLAAEQRFLQDFWEKADVKREGDTIKIKRDFPPGTPDPEMDMYRIYMGQAGGAIENLFKGIISGMWLDDPQSIDAVDDFKELSFPLKGSDTQKMHMKTHELVDLLSAKNMTLTFGDGEKEILKKLSYFIKSGGRYTSPVKFDEKDDPTFMKTMPPFDEPHEHEIIDKIYRAAETELVKLASLQRDRRP